MPRFFATAPRGTEQIVAKELEELGLSKVFADQGGVAFGTSLEAAYRACLWSRTASRVLMPLRRFHATNAKQLYDGVHAIDWTEHLGPDKTLAVDVAGHRKAPAGPSHFVALKTKDAIVDRIRAAEGRRPSVDTSDPDLRIHVYLFDSEVTVSLDLAGQGLHHRGLGRAGGGAPLKENLAAAILRLADWPSRAASGAPLVDPMCGSGTLLVEAGWMALDVAPGLERGRLGAEGWRGHDAGLWRRLRDEAVARRSSGRSRSLRLAGFDAAPSAVAAARHNLERAGLLGKGAARGIDVRVERADLRDAAPPWGEGDPGLVVTNPPYGERLGVESELSVLYALLGDVLKRRFPGWSTWVFCGNPSLAKRIGLRATRRHVLWNGPIECRLLDIPISAKPVESEDGPGWRRPKSPEAAGFAKRLLKNRRGLKQWAEHRGLTAYRLYDVDMRQFNLSVDWYDGAARVEEYERPSKIDAEEADRRLREALQVVAENLELDPADVHLRVRGRRAAGEQHERRAEQGKFREVQEGDLRFWVNLTDYLDTGLFLDDRLLRQEIREKAAGKHFLNLFAYTCTASVAAAVGPPGQEGAATTTSVDLSNTYLDWGRRNFKLNGFDDAAIASDAHRFLRADVLQWLERGRGRRYDLIFVAPPTLSRSKAMRRDFDIQRDHGWLLRECAKFLVPGGTILFSVNLRDFELEPEGLGDFWIEEITPRDFSRRPRIRAWRFTSG